MGGACARAGKYAETRQLFLELVQSGAQPEHMHFNALMTACAKDADATTASGVFEIMPQWGLQPRTEDYNILISCCRLDLSWCRGVFDQMRQAGVNITSRTYQEMLAAHVSAKDGDGARKLIQETT